MSRRVVPRHDPLSSPQLEVVDPRWIAKAVGFTVLAAFVCGYLTLCLLFYQGQWQFVLHPSKTTANPPAPINALRFGAGETGTPQLTAWWIPAKPASRYKSLTLLVLHGGNTSLADSIDHLLILHEQGINVFSIDYRGYGGSGPPHPTQRRMMQDAETALDYLVATRSIPLGTIVPYGTGVGASLAVSLAAKNPALAAVIVENPDGDLLDMVRKDPRTEFLPVSLLFHERFPLQTALEVLRTPKLLVTYSSSGANQNAMIQNAALPKMTIELPAEPMPPGTLSRFLDQYLSSNRL